MIEGNSMRLCRRMRVRIFWLSSGMMFLLFLRTLVNWIVVINWFSTVQWVGYVSLSYLFTFVNAYSATSTYLIGGEDDYFDCDFSIRDSCSSFDIFGNYHGSVRCFRVWFF